MHFQYVPYIWPFIISAFITLGLGAYAFRHRTVRGALPFGICMLLTALWSGSYAMEISGTDLATKILGANMQSIAYSINPVLWLIMVFLFIERDQWLSRRNILFLLILPILTLVVAWTNGMHGLMRQNIYLDISGAFPIMAKTYGPWFWLIAAYSYCLNILSELLLGLSVLRKSALYREQALALFIGLALIFLQNALYIFGIHPVSSYDLTSLTAGVSGMIIAWGIFRFRLFDIVPVARENIIENMEDGMIVLDAQNRIADMNRSAKHIFGSSSINAIGVDAQEFFTKWPALAEICRTRNNMPGELLLQNQGEDRTFEISLLPLSDRKDKHSGLTIILHDVTERKMVQTRLLEQQRTLAILDERERLARDLHDNLGQVLGFINVQAQAIKYELASLAIGTSAAQLEKLIEVVQSAHQDMRVYIKNAKGTEKGFISALKYNIDQYRSHSGINVILQITDESIVEGLETGVAEQLSNIIKEALNNVRKHAQARQVLIEITAAGPAILVQIKDDGRGFDLMINNSSPVEGLGLNIMKERAREIGGELIIESSPGRGTIIILRVPYLKEVIKKCQ